ncbi:MAG TPA: mechanosensitive ion channel domain-containing protein [Burkholderiales bacterium]|nr:mechanosensitive ion channel domain-containing protein [Burkholderiales bacterium]
MRRHETQARQRLRRFRQGSMLAVAITALLLLLVGGDDTAAQPLVGEPPLPDAAAGLEEAAGTIRELMLGFYAFLPKLGIALFLLLVAAGASMILRWSVRRALGHWERSDAFIALGRIAIYLLAIAAALSVMAGDARALLGSVGLVGLALSWALQTPIESFTGWLINSSRGYYRVGDRIEVGEVFGDVYRIDVLTTTVWEAGGPGKPVAGAQATGAMITFPNWEVLRSNIINYTRQFPYVWDEVTLSVANESDLRYASGVLVRRAREILGDAMSRRAEEYQQLLARARLAFDIREEPSAFLSLEEAWTNITVRYLVHARERRRWSTELLLALTEETQKPEHAGRIFGAYPRTQVELRRGWSTGAPLET